jgi:myo-inositol-1(or 4)-monophosphatase
MPADPQTVLTTAIVAAKAAGEVLMSYFRREVTIRFKNGDAADMVSEADVNAEQAVIRVIHQTFPDHAILGEESATDTDVNLPALWVIDPLDGTTNFLHDVPHFAVSIAYFEHGQPICGVVWNPAHNDLYTGLKGQGATHNGQPIQVSPTDRMDQSLIGTGFYYDRGAMMEATLGAIRDLYAHQIHCIRRFGSAALDLCQVASGLYGAYFEFRLSAWDFAAGMLIVQEAGGQVSNGRGQELKLCRSSIIASNTKLHPTMVEIVSRHHDRFSDSM